MILLPYHRQGEDEARGTRTHELFMKLFLDSSRTATRVTRPSMNLPHTGPCACRPRDHCLERYLRCGAVWLGGHAAAVPGVGGLRRRAWRCRHLYVRHQLRDATTGPLACHCRAGTGAAACRRVFKRYDATALVEERDREGGGKVRRSSTKIHLLGNVHCFPIHASDPA